MIDVTFFMSGATGRILSVQGLYLTPDDLSELIAHEAVLVTADGKQIVNLTKVDYVDIDREYPVPEEEA